MQVIGIDTDGCLVCYEERASYNCGETLAEFGSELLTEEEWITLSLQGIIRVWG